MSNHVRLAFMSNPYKQAYSSASTARIRAFLLLDLYVSLKLLYGLSRDTTLYLTVLYYPNLLKLYF